MNDQLLLANKTFKAFRERCPTDIEFQDLSYSVPDGRKSSKCILKNVSGKFISGQLTAILGPSGAGKTSLLHILAGYKHIGTTGNILVNGQTRNVEKFKKISRYIMQVDYFQPYLTVQESMKIAADLKLGSQENRKNKEIMINESLEFLGLNHCRNTLAKSLSGGEKKRFSIALELINNPPVIFLDEPTTGLDDVACFQCIGLLQLLARGGRTVVCVVHTPSAKLFSAFDNTYFINQGQCVYQGYGPSVVSYLSNLGLVCPMSYSPADFMMEVCCKEYGDFQNKMVISIKNGRNTEYYKDDIGKNVSETNQATLAKSEYLEKMKKISFLDQFLILTSRMLMQIWRTKLVVY
ncbi:hypothetical protein HHI36_010279 [Cryptolaemus montrouzieri]|uniref:ABC transporter domain-containing protein n=1 Tax=Cryptolaemus montrouzieri TaxID=559131 RepID=A0ABD2MI99_9CUCU